MAEEELVFLLAAGDTLYAFRDRESRAVQATVCIGANLDVMQVSVSADRWPETKADMGDSEIVDMMPPRAGDAVRLSAPWMGLDAGAVGVLGGMVGYVDGGSITFRAETFRDGRVVSCSGGPATIHTDAAELSLTGETAELPVWRFRNGVRKAGNGEDYTVRVRVWEWTPAD